MTHRRGFIASLLALAAGALWPTKAVAAPSSAPENRIWWRDPPHFWIDEKGCCFSRVTGGWTDGYLAAPPWPDLGWVRQESHYTPSSDGRTMYFDCIDRQIYKEVRT